MFRSQVIQMGDCNTPSTFQWLMMAIFCNCISCFIHVYMDDMFIFLHSINDHNKHLGITFSRLCNNHLSLSKKEVDLCSIRMDYFGHIIDSKGIHTDADKMECIHEWRRPWTFNDVQCFLGLSQYLAHYMPDVSTYTTPLLGCVWYNCPFEWMLLLDKCFQSIKALACKALILHSIDAWNSESIWVITDESKSGVGTIYGQGLDQKTCRPAGFY